MRYPSNIETFRCTVCATINTLATLEEKALERDAKREELVKSKKKAANNEDAQLPASGWPMSDILGRNITNITKSNR